MTSYRITYIDKSGEHVRERLVNRHSHWDACKYGWDHMPPKADDFQVQEVDFEDEHKKRLEPEMGDVALLKAIELLAERIRAGMQPAATEPSDGEPE